MAAEAASVVLNLIKRESEDTDDGAEPEAGQKEIFASWALFILIMLLIVALFTSYMLQQKKIQAIHETVVSIFAGMVVGLSIRISNVQSIQDAVSFDYKFFFNLLLPPIILASGYELHQANFFRNIGTILTFAFAGTFISAMVLGLILFLWTRIPLEGLDITFVDAISVGATLSATDPVTILAIFNTYKVDPKLYTVIFGESILNDAIAIVLFETAQRYSGHQSDGATLTVASLFEGIGIFFLVFFGSLLIGVAVGIATALGLKYTFVRRYPKIESCLIILIAYASYFFSNGLHMSGIVSLLFCGITLKHYAYYNMSRRTQLTTKYLFQVLAQLSENFIFIYLGLSLFTETDLSYKPLFILVTVAGICVARWAAVFPLSKAINSFIRYRAKRRGKEVADELPYQYQAMLFWAGLRGAVGVALAAGLTGPNGAALRATVLVVVILTVIIFGGTTARMLEILGIRTGVVEEIDSDDEFDIETVSGGTYYYKRSGNSLGHQPQPQRRENNNNVPLSSVGQHRRIDGQASAWKTGTYTSGNASVSPPVRPDSAMSSRKNSSRNLRLRPDETAENQTLLGRNGVGSGESGTTTADDGEGDDEADVGVAVDPDEEDLDSDTSDLPPAVTRKSKSAARRAGGGGAERGQASRAGVSPSSSAPLTPFSPAATAGLDPGQLESGEGAHAAAGSSSTTTARGAISSLFSSTTEDQAAWFQHLDEEFIKPTLLLDQGGRGGGGGGGSGHR